MRADTIRPYTHERYVYFVGDGALDVPRTSARIKKLPSGSSFQ